MKYYAGYKFVVAKSFSVKTDIGGYEIKDTLTSLEKNGVLTIRQWYPWDGSSGPCFDIVTSLEASCVHDVLCDYVNLGLLPRSMQPMIDQEYFKICVQKGMWWRWARLRLLAIRWYQTGKAKRFNRKILTA